MRVIIKDAPFEIEFDVGSLKEASAILSDENPTLQRLFDEKFLNGPAAGEGESTAAPVASQPSDAVKVRKPRAGKDATTASAPAPIAPPPAATPPAAANADGLDIPEHLRRPVTAAAPPPPPVMPAAPSIAPAAAPPPTNTTGPAIIAELNRRATTDENKVALVNWLATTGLIAKGAHYDEALAVIPFTTDEKLRPIFTGLALT